MKITVLTIAAASLLSLLVSQPPAPPVAGDSCPREDAAYTGASKCKACHFAQFQSWKKTSMAKAFDTLKPKAAAEAKTKAKLDPEKDYTKDPACLACHTTGYGKPGGYPAVVAGKDWTDDEKKRAADLEGVQCESCHGPGSLYGPYKKDHEDYKKADVIAKGMIEANKDACIVCHNDKSPTAAPFDFEKAVKDADKLHKKVELKNKH